MERWLSIPQRSISPSSSVASLTSAWPRPHWSWHLCTTGVEQCRRGRAALCICRRCLAFQEVSHMRIAQVAPLYERVPPRFYGGTERVVSYLTEELVAQGHDVT